MKIAIGCDHGGFELKNEIIKFLENEKYEVKILVHIQLVLAIIPMLHCQ
jgi:ribose 5-phosphate isomerase RpiB